MTCNEIENRLPAYLENLLSPEEKKNIEGHLASCPRCSRACEDLRKAEEFVQDLTEVEPPPFFEKRIMSRVREEAAQKQGILRKLFYPLYIKVPIQAFATILVAVIAFSVYRTGEPELKHLAPPTITLTEPAKDQVSSESVKALGAPAADLPEKKKQGFAAPPIDDGTKADLVAGPPPSLQEERAPVAKSAVPAIAAREKESLTLRAEALHKTQDRTDKQEAAQSFETPLPEPVRKGKMATMGAAPAPSQTTDAAAQRPALGLTIHVKDVPVAVEEVAERLAQANGRIIERQRRDGREFLRAEVAAQNLAAFLDRIKAIGKVKVEKSPRDVPGGIVTVKIEIVNKP
jgi:hypothetical protein